MTDTGVGMMPERELRALGVALASGRTAGVAVIVGHRDQTAVASLMSEYADRGLFCLPCDEARAGEALASLECLFRLFHRQPAFVNCFVPMEEAIRTGFVALGVPVIDCKGEGTERIASRSLRLGHVRLRSRLPQLPVGFDAAHEGERVLDEDVRVTLGGPGCEIVLTREADALYDGDTRVEGPDIDGTLAELPAALVVEIAGEDLEDAMEPVIESRLHVWLNRLEGVTHVGRRERCRLRVSGRAVDRGLRLGAIGDMLRAMVMEEYGAAVERCRVRWITDTREVTRAIDEIARPAYAVRDARLAGLSDDTAQCFFTCATCQSIAPGHCCVITPQRPGMCGSVTWPDARAACRLNPFGPHRPAEKAGLDAAVRAATGGAISHISLYGLLDDPMSTCSRCECLCAVEPVSGGVALCDREYAGMTPLGMTFEALCDVVARGRQEPGFMGVCRAFIASDKFLPDEGGPLRIVWMPRALKAAVGQALDAAVEARYGIRHFTGMIADETACTDPDALLRWLRERGHPALGLDALV